MSNEWDGKGRRQSDMDLSDIKTSLALIHQDVMTIKDQTERHNEILDIMVIDVDRLKEHKKATEKHTAVAWSAFIGLLIKAWWDWLVRR